MTKGIGAMAHSVTLLTAENRTLQKANQALSRRRRAKESRVRHGGALTAQSARGILAQKHREEQQGQGAVENQSRSSEWLVPIRRCRKCGKPGHNIRTCQLEIELPTAKVTSRF
ncbi:hypothetical protein WHR41_09676 [Cladosporium halotolerans]|uniref:CCHC-type domain-containing protein n=1 Tax=Cladosporium halotolerans TaxID=1052096 RepID=A0AB34KCJ7_9PEZI